VSAHAVGNKEEGHVGVSKECILVFLAELADVGLAGPVETKRGI